MTKLKKTLLYQSGNILVISVITLVVLAGLSVAILSTSVNEKKLANNTQDQNLAKQGAEYAITMAKKDLSEKWAIGMCECSGAPCGCPTTVPFVWLAANFSDADPISSSGDWWNSFATAVAKPDSRMYSAPQYLIIDLGCDAVANTNRFRIIGRGVGVKQESVAFTDISFSMPFNTQNVSSTSTAAVDAMVDGSVDKTFTMAPFTASSSFYQKGSKCNSNATFAQCEASCAGKVRVMAWTADTHCAPVYGPWSEVGVASSVTVTVSGGSHTLACVLKAAFPPPPTSGGDKESPGNRGKHKGYAYGHDKQDNWMNGQGNQ